LKPHDFLSTNNSIKLPKAQVVSVLKAETGSKRDKDFITFRSHEDRPNLITNAHLQTFSQRRSSVLVIEQQDVETLTWLGLTERQAKVFLALLQTGSANAEEISKLSTVHRQEVYRVVTAYKS
jgi:uncharacterized protein (DUF1778 family)